MKARIKILIRENILIHLNKEYQKQMRLYNKIEKEVEILDKAKDPRADILRLTLDGIQSKLSNLSNQIENR